MLTALSVGTMPMRSLSSRIARSITSSFKSYLSTAINTPDSPISTRSSLTTTPAYDFAISRAAVDKSCSLAIRMTGGNRSAQLEVEGLVEDEAHHLNRVGETTDTALRRVEISKGSVLGFTSKGSIVLCFTVLKRGRRSRRPCNQDRVVGLD